MMYARPVQTPHIAQHSSSPNNYDDRIPASLGLPRERSVCQTRTLQLSTSLMTASVQSDRAPRRQTNQLSRLGRVQSRRLLLPLASINSREHFLAFPSFDVPQQKHQTNFWLSSAPGCTGCLSLAWTLKPSNPGIYYKGNDGKGNDGKVPTR